MATLPLFVTAKIQKISKNAQLYYQKVVNLPFFVTEKAQTKAFTMIYKQKVVVLPLFVSLKHFPKKKRGQWYLYKSDFDGMLEKQRSSIHDNISYPELSQWIYCWYRAFLLLGR